MMLERKVNNAWTRARDDCALLIPQRLPVKSPIKLPRILKSSITRPELHPANVANGPRIAGAQAQPDALNDGPIHKAGTTRFCCRF
jgi:hypothetical protein